MRAQRIATAISRTGRWPNSDYRSISRPVFPMPQPSVPQLCSTLTAIIGARRTTATTDPHFLISPRSHGMTRSYLQLPVSSEPAVDGALSSQSRPGRLGLEYRATERGTFRMFRYRDRITIHFSSVPLEVVSTDFAPRILHYSPSAGRPSLHLSLPRWSRCSTNA